MSLTCLQIIQTACRRIGITAPNAAVGATDPQIIQLVALSEEEGQEHADRARWQSLQTEATFTTVATELQGALATIAPGFESIVNDTIWNRTLRRPVYGPKSQQDWQQARAMQLNGPFNSYRIVNDTIKFYPAPVAGETCAFEYMSENWVTTSIGGTSSSWTNDADTIKLDDKLFILGVVWRWKAAKGLDYAEDFSKYEHSMIDKIAKDGGKPRLNMSGANYDIQPGIFIPAGNW